MRGLNCKTMSPLRAAIARRFRLGMAQAASRRSHLSAWPSQNADTCADWVCAATPNDPQSDAA